MDDEEAESDGKVVTCRLGSTGRMLVVSCADCEVALACDGRIDTVEAFGI